MDYEKAYKKALERARIWKDKSGMPKNKQGILDDIFPEIKESEDERIRESLIGHLKECRNNTRSEVMIDEYGKWIAWLEKQGKFVKEYEDRLDRCSCESFNKGYKAAIEHQKEKPADKVEPKFKNGQWIVWKNKCYKVNYNGCGYELVDQDDLRTSLEYGTVDESAHLWDVTKDANDGDVLYCKSDCGIEYIVMNNGINCNNNIDSYFRYNSVCGLGIYIPSVLSVKGDNIVPATKEQRDLLFQRMKEKGYEWNVEKKELKKIEPKFKVEAKFHEGEWITNGDYTWKILMVKFMCYVLQSQGGNVVEDTIPHVDEQFHSFTIEDAKTGDVLASELCDSIILFKGINDDNNIDFYCDYDFYETDVPGDRFSVNNGQHYGNVEDSKDFHPATKEQRDILMKAMADAGYAFDFKKLELKKIVVPIFNIGDTIVEKDLDECGYGTIKDIKNGQYIFTDGSGINIDEQDEWQLKTSTNIERKPADWSEEDEKMLNQVISIIEDADDYLIRAENISIYTNWLKSLKHKYHIH